MRGLTLGTDGFVMKPDEEVRVRIATTRGRRVLLNRVYVLREMRVTHELAEAVDGPSVRRWPTGRQEVRLLLDPTESDAAGYREERKR